MLGNVGATIKRNLEGVLTFLEVIRCVLPVKWTKGKKGEMREREIK